MPRNSRKKPPKIARKLPKTRKKKSKIAAKSSIAR